MPEAPGKLVDIPIGITPVVLFFFPLSFSPVCADGFCSIASEWNLWKQTNCSTYGISVDSPFVVDKFKNDLNLLFPLLSDFNKEISKKWDVLHEDLFGMHGVSKRSAFVIDLNSNLIYKDIKEDPGKQLNFEEILNFANQAASLNG